MPAAILAAGGGGLQLTIQCTACCLLNIDWLQALMTRNTLKTFPWSSGQGQPLRNIVLRELPCALPLTGPPAAATCPHLPPRGPACSPCHPCFPCPALRCCRGEIVSQLAGEMLRRSNMFKLMDETVGGRCLCCGCVLCVCVGGCALGE